MSGKHPVRWLTKPATWIINSMLCPCLLLMAACQTKDTDSLLDLSRRNELEQRFLFTRPQAYVAPELRLEVERKLVQAIDGAKQQISIWCYSFSHPELIAALARAQQRGVSIEVIGTPADPYTALRSLGIQPAIRNRSGLQHAKVILIDERLLVSGTGNFTRSGLEYNHNVFIFLEVDRQQAALIRKSLAAEGLATEALYLPRWRARILIAPGDGRYIQQRLLRDIWQAERSLHYMIFSHTDQSISAALLARSRSGNIDLEGIYDDANNDNQIDTSSEALALNSSLGLSTARIFLEGNRRVYSELDAAGMPVYHGGHLHHKTLIVDQNRVWTGSWNWSASARDRNLEIYFEFDDPAIADLFEAEFRRVRQESLLMARDPLPDWISQASMVPLPKGATESGRICTTAKAIGDSAPRATLFAVYPALIFSYHYQFDPALQDESGQSCLNADDWQSSSAGLVQSRQYPLVWAPGAESTLQTNEQSQAIWVNLPGAIVPHRVTPGMAGTPAEQLDLLFQQPLQAIHPDTSAFVAGTLWLEPTTPTVKTIHLWGRTGWTQASLTQTGAGIYPLPPGLYSGGDAFVFLELADGSSGLACLQSGSELASNLHNVQRYILQEKGRFINCLHLD
ncbi:MAG: hypothetical protein KDK39_01475 [Leptospiraceae bacterium]|nr:hypothetical protein [Leptospiraceae bacterium]